MKTTEERIEEIMNKFVPVCEDTKGIEEEILRHQLEALVLQAKLEQLKER